MEKKELRPYQIEDLAFYMANPKCANLSDPGTGKTGSVVVYMQYLFDELNTKTMWAMPKSLLSKNKREIHEFTGLKDEQVIIVDGTPKQRLEQMADPRGVVWLMGFKRMADDWVKMTTMHPEIKFVCIDEFHMGGYKNPTSKRSSELFKLNRRTPYFLPMSGTLIDGRLDSCYTAIHCIEPRYYANHYSFLAQHELTDDFGNHIAWFNHEKIGRIFIRHCVRRPFEEVYGKEEKVMQNEVVPMHEKQRAAYSEFEEKAILELENEFLTGENPAVATMRCRQIMAHPYTMGLLKEDELTGKEEALQVHVENHLNKGEPLLIFAALQPEQERIAKLCAEWGLKVGLINGNVSTAERVRIDEAFRAGELDCVVASPATASVGFNWGHVDHVIFMSISYQNVDFVQAYRRAIRGVRKKPLWITVMEYEKSIDQTMFWIVDRKSRDLSKVDSTYEKLSLSVK